MTFEEYIREELKYYDLHPNDDEALETHCNEIVSIEYDYTATD